MRILDLHLEDCGLDTSLTALKKEINAAKSAEDNKNLQMVYTKLGQVRENIVSNQKIFVWYCNSPLSSSLYLVLFFILHGWNLIITNGWYSMFLVKQDYIH